MKLQASPSSLNSKAAEDRSWIATKLLLDHSIQQMKREIKQIEKKIIVHHTKIEMAHNYVVNVREEWEDSQKNYQQVLQGTEEDFVLQTLKQRARKSPYWFKKAQQSQKIIEKRKEMAKQHLRFTEDTLAKAERAKTEVEEELHNLLQRCADLKQKCEKIEHQAREVRQIERQLVKEGVVKGVNEIDCLLSRLTIGKAKSNQSLLRAPKIKRK